MYQKFAFFVSLIGLTVGLPISDSEDSSGLLSQTGIHLKDLSSILMSPHFESEAHLDTGLNGLSAKTDLKTTGFQSSHFLEAAKDTAVGAVLMPVEVSAEAGAVGGAIPAAAAIKGTAVGSAMAAPVILKAVALPGLAAGKTAAFLSVPHLIASNLRAIPELLTHNLKASVDNSVDHLTNWVILEDIAGQDLKADVEHESIEGLDITKGVEHVTKGVGAAVGVLKAKALGVKAGAVGLATKGLLVGKKVAYVAGRALLKPVAIIAGANLKMLGTGLTIGGKLIGGTGAHIAKTGTAIKFIGLGGIGLGATAVGWGLDKSIDNHIIESLNFDSKLH